MYYYPVNTAPVFMVQRFSSSLMELNEGSDTDEEKQDVKLDPKSCNWEKGVPELMW